VVLGVGTGGVMHGTEAWEAVGVPWAERGRRTDEALALLPGLISGETVELPSGASITLSPGAEVPPILVAGNSPAALRRAIRHGAGWFTSMPIPEEIADSARQLPETAPIAVRAVAPLDDETPAQAAKRFAAYADAGATWLVLSTTGDDWHSQWELIAEAATLLPRVHE
jgi:alkanesulfonate monooxygenase SsuD/methylene tetrahydromethanopterin reductase-like flavin-dependent oxidoreductase (luciferase family)